jgi:hypothetical protein
MKYPKMVKRKHLMSDEFKYRFTEHKTNIPNHNVVIMEKRKRDSKTQDEGKKRNSRIVGAASRRTCSTTGPPDYLANYFTIVSSEQHQHYEREFRTDYREY